MNASEAGITLRNATGVADVRLVRLSMTARDPGAALEDLAAMLKSPPPGPDPFEAEKSLLSGYRVIPLAHLPRMWATSGAVRNWPRLADVWLDVLAKERP